MPDILVRSVSEETVKRLRGRARRNGRSLQAEARLALESAAGVGFAEARATAERWQARWKRKFSDSAALVREDRGR